MQSPQSQSHAISLYMLPPLPHRSDLSSLGSVIFSVGHVYPNQQQQRPPFENNGMGGAGVGSPHGPPQAHFNGGGGGPAGGGPPDGAH